MKKKAKIIGICIAILIVCSIFIIIFYNNISNWLSMSYSKSNFRNILEIIYFITSPLLLIVAIVGLKQINIAKESIKINSTRESLTLAAEQCKYYFEHIIPLQNKLNDLMKAAEIKNFGEAEVKLNSDGKSINYKYKINYKYDLDKMRPLILCASEVLNAMEAFCVFFSARAANEAIAFSSIGSNFINEIEELLPIVCMTQEAGAYKNIMKLYIKWKNRTEKLDALIKKSEAELKLKQECAIDMTSIGI